MADEPFRPAEPSDAELKAAYYCDHDLREMYSRDNTERRRTSGHTYRKYLTGAQDRKLTATFIKIRAEWDVSCNNDAVIVFAQQLIDAGKQEEVDAKLLKIVAESHVPRRLTAATETPTPA